MKTRSPTKTPGILKTSADRKKNSGPKAATTSGANGGNGAAQPMLQEQIAARAYSIWLKKGCPEGCEQENWLQAEEELMQTSRPHS